MANGDGLRLDWKVVVMVVGWAFSLGMWYFKGEVTHKEMTEHRNLEYHTGVRVLTDALDQRVHAVELGQVRIEARLDEILRLLAEQK